MPDIKAIVPGAPDNWQLNVVYRPIRHIYFRVYPDIRTVRISAPSGISKREFLHAVQSRSAWLMRKMTSPGSKRDTGRPISTMQNDDSCMVWGNAIPVLHRTGAGRPKVVHDVQSGIIVQAPHSFTSDRKHALIDQWLRSLLRNRIAVLLEHWAPAMQVTVAQFRLKKMKTRWGSCNISQRRIWLNAVLIHLPEIFLEYVLVHELAHLLEPGHNRRFHAIVENLLPDWKQRKKGLDEIDLKS